MANARWKVTTGGSLIGVGGKLYAQRGSSNNFAVSGALEPAYAIAGDSFDYAVESDHLHVAITDGMGHGLRAALLASLAVSALRHARRRG